MKLLRIAILIAISLFFFGVISCEEKIDRGHKVTKLLLDSDEFTTLGLSNDALSLELYALETSDKEDEIIILEGWESGWNIGLLRQNKWDFFPVNNKGMHGFETAYSNDIRFDDINSDGSPELVLFTYYDMMVGEKPLPEFPRVFRIVNGDFLEASTSCFPSLQDEFIKKVLDFKKNEKITFKLHRLLEMEKKRLKSTCK